MVWTLSQHDGHMAVTWVEANVSTTVTSHVRHLHSFLGMRVSLRPSEHISLSRIRSFGSLQDAITSASPSHSAVDGRHGMAASAEFARETIGVYIEI